jgi:hypothetical protein
VPYKEECALCPSSRCDGPEGPLVRPVTPVRPSVRLSVSLVHPSYRLPPRSVQSVRPSARPSSFTRQLPSPVRPFEGDSVHFPVVMGHPYCGRLRY